MAVVRYELRGSRAALSVDLAAATASWGVRGSPVDVAQVLRLARRDEVEALVRRALAETRAYARECDAPASEDLRRLAAGIWREFRGAADGGERQARLPGI